MATTTQQTSEQTHAIVATDTTVTASASPIAAASSKQEGSKQEGYRITMSENAHSMMELRQLQKELKHMPPISECFGEERHALPVKDVDFCSAMHLLEVQIDHVAQRCDDMNAIFRMRFDVICKLLEDTNKHMEEIRTQTEVAEVMCSNLEDNQMSIISYLKTTVELLEKHVETNRKARNESQ